MRAIFFYLVLTLFSVVVFQNDVVAQKGLEGLWEGTITKGGIYSEEGYKFELYLKKKGKYWEGKSIVYLDDGRKIEMDVHGRFYKDRSMYFKDIKFIPREDDISIPPFYRKYQLIYDRSIWESKLDGYWQENVFEPFEKRRRQGRVFLRKVKKPSKA